MSYPYSLSSSSTNAWKFGAITFATKARCPEALRISVRSVVSPAPLGLVGVGVPADPPLDESWPTVSGRGCSLPLFRDCAFWSSPTASAPLEGIIFE